MEKKAWDHLRRESKRPPIGSGSWSLPEGPRVNVTITLSGLVTMTFSDLKTGVLNGVVLGSRDCLLLSEFLLELGEQLKGEA